MIRPTVILLALFASACTPQSGALGACGDVQPLLDRQIESINHAQSQLASNLATSDIQAGLAGVISDQTATIDRCANALLNVDRDCTEKSQFSRLQDVGGVLRALHSAPLSDSSDDRLFVQRMLTAAHDESQRPIPGHSCAADGA